MLPVSLQVLEAGDGGGGMSIRSAVSFCTQVPFELPGAEVIAPIEAKI